MYICPECGEKLDKNATICPCCGRGNKENHNSKFDFVFIVVGLIIFSIGLITTVSFAYENKVTIYNGTNYSFTYKNNYWLMNDEIKAVDQKSDILVYNSESNIYVQFDKEMMDVGYNVDIDSSREDLYTALYREMVSSTNKEYSNISSGFIELGDKYYLTANYYQNGIQAKMFVLCYRDKIMTFYIVHNGKDYKIVEEKLLELFETIELK